MHTLNCDASSLSNTQHDGALLTSRICCMNSRSVQVLQPQSLLDEEQVLSACAREGIKPQNAFVALPTCAVLGATRNDLLAIALDYQLVVHRLAWLGMMFLMLEITEFP